jgi:hypothetical protein
VSKEQGVIDYESLYKRAIAYAKRRGIDSDAEDFAQECLIKAFQIGKINIEYVYLNFVSKHRANKRILGNSNAALGANAQSWLDASIDSSNADGSRLGDFIRDTRDELESVTEIESIRELAFIIFNTIQCEKAKEWSQKCWAKYIEESL